MQSKFIKYCILFFIPVVFGYVIVEKLTIELPSIFKTNQTFIELNKDNINTLVLGSSQMMNGINAERINSLTLNLASGSQHHNTDYNLLKTLRPKFKNLKTVVLEVSYSHFELPHNRISFWKNPLYLKFYKVNMFERQPYFKDKLVFMSNTPLFINNIYDHYIKNNLDYKLNKFGFDTINFSGDFKDLNYNEDKILLFPKIDINTVENLDVFDTNIKLFYEMLNYLKEEKLHVIICKVPMYKTFLPARNKAILKRRDSILKVVFQNNKDLNFLDHEEDTINFNVFDYINHSHLNPDGAKKFTLKLNEIINNIE